MNYFAVILVALAIVGVKFMLDASTTIIPVFQ
jgi:hypothetical protein